MDKKQLSERDICTKFITPAIEYLTFEGSLKSTFVSLGEVIIAVSGSTTGKVCITGIQGYIYDGLAVIRTFSKSIDNHYLLMLMKYFYNLLNSSKTGSAFPNINTDMLKNMAIPLPPLTEQQRIVQKVDELMQLCNKLDKTTE